MSHILSLSRNNLTFSSVTDSFKSAIEGKSPMIKIFSSMNSNNTTLYYFITYLINITFSE